MRPTNTLVLCLIVGLLAACSKKSEEPPARPAAVQTAAAPAPAPAPQAAPQPTFRVSRVDLGAAIGGDKKVASPTTTFKPGDTIYASVQSEGAAPSAKLVAKWTYEDGQVVNESTQTIAATGPAVTEFHIAKPDGWPAGKYTLVVTANGTPSAPVQFTVAP
jgi:hypothetical protein